ncbi:MAG TPA: protein kinase [Terriglobia bacterium]|nr:protein kinase [Terriglobia bacterium]
MTTSIASNLVGKTINGWIVEKKLPKSIDTTGGAFSSGYVVRNEKEGTVAFMKAINIAYAVNMFGASVNRIDLINQITTDFKYERDLLDFCGKSKMDRIVVAIDSGEYVDKTDPYFVPYLIFELCEEGDIRRHKRMSDPGLAWRLRIFHGVCVGIKQLHSKDIVHQDLKPSNVLVFESEKSKLADLGRSSQKGTKADFDDHCGDLGYTPIELQYRQFDSDWDIRRKGADLYMLGALFAFLTANVHFFGVVLSKIPTAYHPRLWTGTYSDALPVLRAATYDAITEVVTALPNQLQSDAQKILEWLCNPEPNLRGHPVTRAQRFGNPFALERIISAADLLARKAQFLK